jgi:hypothetical protein
VIPNVNSFLFKFVDGDYQMLMYYNGHSVTLPVVYIPHSPDTAYRGIWDIQHMVDMCNATIGSLYTALNAIAPLPTADMPYFTYNNVTQLFSFTANKSYFASNLTTPIIVGINNKLLNFFEGLQFAYTIPGNSTMYEIIVADYYNNELQTGYYTMTQQAPTFALYSDFNRLVFTTSLPIQNEYIGSSTAVPILQDYCPADLNISTFRNPIVYTAEFPYRQVRMKSDMAFYNISIDCNSSDIAGNLHLMTLPPNSAANIKLMFTEHAHNKYA